MKICVYAIAKNESKFVERWVRSMNEADGIYVLDTGSEDDTAERLRAAGAVVKTDNSSPFRFDTARNKSLDMVPQDADLCVCTDLDEVFEPGWRAHMEEALKKGVEMLSYRYTWSFNDDGSEGFVFWITKAHLRHGFCWKHPVHEVVGRCDGRQARIAIAEGVQLNHYPDSSKSRSSYLPLLELSVKECPDNDRNMHYLGREYMYYGRYDDAIRTLQRHLALPSATWKDERAASMRYISRCYMAQGNTSEAEKWIFRAIAEAPYLREPWVEAANQAVARQQWHGACYFAERALEIKERSMSYINEPGAWTYAPYDCLAVALYYLGEYEEALVNADKAIGYAPYIGRLKENRNFITAKLNGAV